MVLLRYICDMKDLILNVMVQSILLLMLDQHSM